MQHLTIRAILLPLLLLLGVVYATAQVRAITSDGDQVILYPNGTWEYLNSRPAPTKSPRQLSVPGLRASVSASYSIGSYSLCSERDS